MADKKNKSIVNYSEALEKCDKLLDKMYRYANIDDVYTDIKDVKNVLKDCQKQLCVTCNNLKEHPEICKNCRWKFKNKNSN